ncbi:MAG: aminoacetone oxidase family FAD-binding enzyme [Clostridiales bacterium]|nr:aminoacetone oxidase family FAD-binding enzyme [Clostridiales bacterium]
MTKVGIVGGGAAGLFAACFLSGKKVSFEILEKGGRVGRKFLLTGHGRCNITNRKTPADLKNGYHEAGNFIYRAISSFTPEDAVAFLENELHVPLKEEDNNRMFPVSDKSKTILDAMISYIGKENITTGFDCIKIDRIGERFEVTSKKGEKKIFDSLILATGGNSFPKTGSDGSGYRLATDLGHDMTELIPALTGIEVGEKDRAFTSSLAGVSVPAGASLYYDSKKRASGEGEVLFTHKGLSGPAIRELSREIPRDIGSRDGWIELDFTPGRNETELDSELAEEILNKGNAKLTTLMGKYVPSSVAAGLGHRAGVSGIYASESRRAHRKACVRELKHLGLSIGAPSFEDAYVTRGGITCKELMRETMESKKHKGLYLIGEMIDVDGISGGYNLQAAMSEAFIAVNGICGV